MKHFMVFALIMLSGGQLNASEIECETKENHEYGYGIWKGCVMRYVTAIDSPNVTISPRDETIRGLSFGGNKKINFLPVKVAETFPNLMAYYAYDCSLTKVSKSNFENLSKVKTLLLQSNRIVKIASNTFEDLTSLEQIYLQHNKIEAINGDVFQKLKKLAIVHLHDNVCTHENFQDPARIAAMPQIVTQKCGFNETVDQIPEKETQDTQIQQIVANKTVSELENCQSKNTKLNAELVAANNFKDRNDNVTQDRCDRFLDLIDRLEMQYNKTLTANNKDFIDTVNLKTSEIENLMKELLTKNEEINAKNLKIKNLEERVKTCDCQNCQW